MTPALNALRIRQLEPVERELITDFSASVYSYAASITIQAGQTLRVQVAQIIGPTGGDVVYSCESSDFGIEDPEDWTLTMNNPGTYTFEYSIVAQTAQSDVSPEYTVTLTVTVQS